MTGDGDLVASVVSTIDSWSLPPEDHADMVELLTDAFGYATDHADTLARALDGLAVVLTRQAGVLANAGYRMAADVVLAVLCDVAAWNTREHIIARHAAALDEELACLIAAT